jgi:NAD(P)-dependent dehydrogenase (short-subunit alcohol dehydrogenase family)
MKRDELSRRAVLAVGGAAALAGASGEAPAADGARAGASRRFAGRVAMVTGATSGMGAVTARALAAEGARVAFCGRRAEEGRAVEKSIRDAGGESLFVQADVTVESQVRALFDAVDRRWGRLDYAFNNVGTSQGTGLLHELSSEDFETVMATNLRGNFLAMKYEIPRMLAAGGGVIVGNSSIAGLRALPTKSHYSAAKQGVHGLYCTAAWEYAARNIRVNVVAPGLIRTEKAMQVLKGNERAMDSRIPMGHIGRSEDVAATVLWLFSDEARYITGSILPVDGGQSVTSAS